MRKLHINHFYQPIEPDGAKASIADIDDVRVPFLHINHLIINKKAVNRPKDQLDIIYLEKILKIRDEQSGQ